MAYSRHYVLIYFDPQIFVPDEKPRKESYGKIFVGSIQIKTSVISYSSVLALMNNTLNCISAAIKS